MLSCYPWTGESPSQSTNMLSCEAWCFGPNGCALKCWKSGLKGLTANLLCKNAGNLETPWKNVDIRVLTWFMIDLWFINIYDIGIITRNIIEITLQKRQKHVSSPSRTKVPQKCCTKRLRGGSAGDWWEMGIENRLRWASKNPWVPWLSRPKRTNKIEERSA